MITAVAEDNYFRYAGARWPGKAMLAGVAVSLAAFVAGVATGAPVVLILSGMVGTSCIYGAMIYGYREWRTHYDFWARQGLTEDQIRQKWRDLYDAGT